MDLGLSGKRALVNGASKGIGRATAMALAREGVDLCLVSRNIEGLAEVARQISAAADVSVKCLAADLSSQNDIDQIVAEVDRLDILVYNAGSVPMGSLSAIDDKKWRAGWDLKLFGYIGLCRGL